MKENIYPLMFDIKVLMLNISNDYNIDLSKFTNEENEKLVKYFNFFNEMIHQIYYT